MSAKRNWSRLRNISEWSIGARRLFLVTLPISFPLWILAMASLALLMWASGSAAPIVRLWNAPPTRRRRYAAGYHASRSKAHMMNITDPQDQAS